MSRGNELVKEDVGGNKTWSFTPDARLDLAFFFMTVSERRSYFLCYNFVRFGYLQAQGERNRGFFFLGKVKLGWSLLFKGNLCAVGVFTTKTTTAVESNWESSSFLKHLKKKRTRKHTLHDRIHEMENILEFRGGLSSECKHFLLTSHLYKCKRVVDAAAVFEWIFSPFEDHT